MRVQHIRNDEGGARFFGIYYQPRYDNGLRGLLIFVWRCGLLFTWGSK